MDPAPQTGEGWDRPDTVDQRGMGSHQHRRAKRDGTIEWRELAHAPQSVEGLSRPITAERRGMVSPVIAERSGIGLSRRRRANTSFFLIFIYNCCT